MEDQYEYILSQLTEAQIRIVVDAVELRPYMTSEDDLATFLRLKLFERPLIDPGHENYIGIRESREQYGPPRPSEPFAKEWVAWYKKRPR